MSVVPPIFPGKPFKELHDSPGVAQGHWRTRKITRTMEHGWQKESCARSPELVLAQGFCFHPGNKTPLWWSSFHLLLLSPPHSVKAPSQLYCQPLPHLQQDSQHPATLQTGIPVPLLKPSAHQTFSFSTSLQISPSIPQPQEHSLQIPVPLPTIPSPSSARQSLSAPSPYPCLLPPVSQ